MSPRFVRPYVKSNKNDARDAEAVGRPSMRFVAVKSVAQQDMLALHRVRSLLIRERTALNEPDAWPARRIRNRGRARFGPTAAGTGGHPEGA
jgi:transposase